MATSFGDTRLPRHGLMSPCLRLRYIPPATAAAVYMGKQYLETNIFLAFF